MARDATIEATTTAADRPGDDADAAAEVVGACCSVLDAPLAEAAAAELAKGFAALADPVRLRLLSMIAATEEVCSCDLLEPLGKAQPTVSHHTKALAEAGLIIGEKRGRWVWWRVVPERVEALRDALT
jgi:ArsR family transcriptional regulator, arsenate/arsenite/antimonite-responsive transcriptional repressor